VLGRSYMETKIASLKPLQSFKIHRVYSKFKIHRVYSKLKIHRVYYKGRREFSGIQLHIQQQASSEKRQPRRPLYQDYGLDSTALLDDLDLPWSNDEIRDTMVVDELRRDLVSSISKNVYRGMRRIQHRKNNCQQNVEDMLGHLVNWWYGLTLQFGRDPSSMLHHEWRKDIVTMRRWLRGTQKTTENLDSDWGANVEFRRTFQFLRQIDAYQKVHQTKILGAESEGEPQHDVAKAT
jgi:hypothetical protein